MKRTTIFIEEPMERDLTALAEQERRPKAALVREAIREYLARRSSGGRRLGFAAIGASGRSDTAERHEGELWGEAPAEAPRAARQEPPTPRPSVPPQGYLPRKS